MEVISKFFAQLSTLFAERWGGGWVKMYFLQTWIHDVSWWHHFWHYVYPSAPSLVSAKNGIWSTWYGISHIGLGVVDMFIGHIILSFPLKQQSVETWYFQLLINEELIRWKSSIAGRDRRDWTCHYPRFPLAVPNHTHIQLTDSKRPKPPLLLEKLCLVS